MNRPPAWRRPARPVLSALVAIAALALCTAAMAQDKKAPAAPASKAKTGASKSKAKPDAAKSKAAKPTTAAPKPKTAKPAPAPKTAAAALVPADDELILPFVGENTFLVARLDVGGIDVDALGRFAMQVTEADAGGPQADPAKLAQEKAKAAEDIKKIRTSLAEFQTAGGHHVYVLADVTDLITGAGLMFAVPLRAGADAAKLTKMIADISPPDIKHVREQVGQTLLVGSKAQIERMKALAAGTGGAGAPADAAQQADLNKAMAAGGDAPVRMALVPGEQARAFAEQAFGPAAVQAGVDAATFTRGVKWVTLAVTQKPTYGLVVTVRAADAERAVALISMANNAMAKQGPPGAAAAAMKELVKHEGDTITITLNGQQLMPGLMAARRQANAIAAQREAQGAPAAPEGDGLD